MWRWYDWLHEMKKRDEVRRMEVEHQKLVNHMIKVHMEVQVSCTKLPSQRREEEDDRF